VSRRTSLTDADGVAAYFGRHDRESAAIGAGTNRSSRPPHRRATGRMSHPLKVAVAALTSLLAIATSACTSPSRVVIDDVSIPAALESSASVYLSIENRGGTDDFLVGVDSEEVEAALHRTTIVDGGRASMERVADLQIPAGETVLLEPGSLHLMITSDTPLKRGQTIPLTLTFRESGKVTTTAVVE